MVQKGFESHEIPIRFFTATTSFSQGGWPQSFVSADAAQTLREVRWPEEWPYTEVQNLLVSDDGKIKGKPYI
jgi:hypothetical protein